MFFRVIDPQKAVLEVSNFLYTTSQLAQTTLRSILGEAELDELLSQRETLNLRLQGVLDTDTAPWGVKVAKVEVKQVDLPENMIRAIARQAEAERERRAKIIHADGEFVASAKLAQAAEVLQKQPAAIQLRYLQTAGRDRRREEHDGDLPRCPSTSSRRSAACSTRLRPRRKNRRRFQRARLATIRGAASLSTTLLPAQSRAG